MLLGWSAFFKIQEESEMWKQYELINAKRSGNFASSPKETNRSVFNEIHKKLEEKQHNKH